MTPPVVEHVALGDSYASGAGVPPYTAPNNCCRGLDAYHGLLAYNFDSGGRMIQQPLVRACSGASIRDMYLTQPGTEGAQLSALSPYTTRLVTVAIGGNDLGFGAQLRRCAALPCTGPQRCD